MPRFVLTYDVNHEAEIELKAQCLSRGFTDCVTSDGKKWRLPKTILLALDDTIYSVDKNFDEAVIATKSEMEKQEKPFKLEKIFLSTTSAALFISDEECKD
jgi:hypothetical protein